MSDDIPAVSRLPKPWGQRIDRTRPVRFSFEGKHYTGFTGDTLASALMANGRHLMSRSFKYHRARGPMTLAGHDVNTMVQLPEEANVLADLTPIAEGLSVMGQNYSGSLDHDRDAILGHFSRFMPVGFYYRAFFKPAGMWKYWEPFIRKKAGLGQLDVSFKPTYHDKAYLFADVAVIGSGPAGLSSALAAAEAGARVLLIEQEPELGGSLNWARFDIEGKKASETRALIERAKHHPNIRALTHAVCNAWFADNYLPVISGNRLYKVRAKTCVMAAGAFEQPVIFRNNDLPGIMLASAAQRLMRLYGVKPGKRAVILTGHNGGYLAALDMLEAGMEIAAVADMRSDDCKQAAPFRKALEAKNVRIYSGTTVFEAISGKNRDGNPHVSGVELRRILLETNSSGAARRGEVETSGNFIECDTLLMSSGYMPVWQLPCQAGGKLAYDESSARFSIDGLPDILTLAGSVNGYFSLDNVLQDGEQSGRRAAAKASGKPAGAELPATPKFEAEAPVNYPWPIFPHPKGKEFVDLDEDLQIRDIINTVRLGYRDIQLIKRFTTLGMGPLQGRQSALPAARLVAEATSRSISETGITTARPPFMPEKLALIAGRGFSPVRNSALWRHHEKAGAQWLMAGTWRRPAYYGDPAQREAHIQEEARAVRERVGLIDVSTLGGLEIRGPDAVEFLERMYTFGFAKLPVGRSRYALMTAEDGVIMDDGVCCRLGEQHFYVTATTSGVDRVWRAMTKWNAQWRLDVDIANVTSAWAAVNLAGPKSREVLARAGVNIELSGSSFPYLGVQTGIVAGIPARLMRVGFVGELGYEIHVPSRYGEALWDALMKAGAEFGIRPFGVEAQRLLRLEKGHVIVSQDTDGMTHPAEVGMEWAIGRKKPFFVGKRSISILEAQPLQRKLVGFTLPKNAPQKPLEGQLILDEAGNITGAITSVGHSVALGQTIGLAWCAPSQSKAGTTLPIRCENAPGGRLLATVVALPFYDPKNLRQEV
ncbi:MAG: (2Fe-2S)-binding protein [Azoarcus sp.]|jgi:sarcosine oxidase subunit alpha|nr:(2Fe-2S)-binding protein [Azoarcus sp.]